MLSNLFSRILKTRTLAVLIVVACLTAMMGCAASNSGSAGSMDNTVTTGIPNSTGTETPEESPAGCEGMLLTDVTGEAVDPNEEQPFTLPEFPGVQFLKQGPAVYVQQGDTRRYVLSGSPLYLADLNGDGYREFCTSVSVGSGTIDQRIYVFDFADDMRYTMHQRPQYDYDLSLVDGRLVTLRYAHMGAHYGQEPLCEGDMVIEDREIFFVSGELRIQGIVESPRFAPDVLQEMIAFIQDYMDKGMRFSVFFRPATNYYMDIYQDAIRSSIVQEEEGRLWLDLGNIQGNRDVLQYLAMLELLTGTYIGYSYLEEYVYHDPANPSQLIVCTELRDRGYREVQTYYEDLIAGKCQAHPDTYIVHLDRHAIYRWGEDTNLYQEAE